MADEARRLDALFGERLGPTEWATEETERELSDGRGDDGE